MEPKELSSGVKQLGKRGSPNFKGLGALFRALPESEKAYYTKLGKIATAGAKFLHCNKSAFGVLPAQAMKSAKTLARREHWNQLAAKTTPAERLRTVCEHALAQDNSLSAMIANVRSELRFELKCIKQQDVLAETAVKDWQLSTQAMSNAQQLVTAAPAFEPFQTCLVPEPSPARDS